MLPLEPREPDIDDINPGATGAGVRTIRSSVTFTAPFLLRGVNGPQPAGTYSLETEEEAIVGNDRTAYRRVATILYVPGPGTTSSYTVDPRDLAASLALDAAAGTIIPSV